MGTKSDGSFDWNGDWALVVADLGNGGTMQLDSWSMQFSDLSASDTSVETAGLEYEVVPPTSGLAKASISKNELEALSGTGSFEVRARYRAVDGVSQVSAWTTKTIELTKKEQVINFPAEIAAAGAQIAFQSQTTTGTSKLPDVVAYAVYKGLGLDDALRGMSLGPANFLKLTTVGSIELGKDADLVVLSGPPFELSSEVLAVMIDGNWVYEKESK
jgi:imidazolonepropionase-like amidohydrolase